MTLLNLLTTRAIFDRPRGRPYRAVSEDQFSGSWPSMTLWECDGEPKLAGFGVNRWRRRGSHPPRGGNLDQFGIYMGPHTPRCWNDSVPTGTGKESGDVAGNQF